LAIVRAAAKLIMSRATTYQYRGPALSLGEPDVYLTYDEVPTLRTPRRVAKQPFNWIGAADFFRAIGIQEVTTVDIPGSHYAPDIVHDLNQPLPRHLTDCFNLVLDPGTLEHVFDVRAALENIAVAVRQGGSVIHFVPVYSYNGGYYSLNPEVLIDFYSQNGFEEPEAFLIMWDRYRPYSGKTRCYRYAGRLRERHGLADWDQWRFSPHLLLFARKQANCTSFSRPIQLEHGTSPASRRGLLSRLSPRVPYQPLIYATRARFERLRVLAQTRKLSFWI